jgi:predicted nucleotidyltransferase
VTLPSSINRPLCEALCAEHPYPLLFATISGAHLYGFSSADSDYDLRGAHVLPAREVLGLHALRETIEQNGVREGVEIDLVTHDLTKFCRMMLKKNGYVLEQLLSPLVVRTSPAHEALKALAPGCITRFHAFHYLGFAETQWNLFSKEPEPRVKPLLYVYRVLLTGIHLMRTGFVEANLVNLNADTRLSHIDDLIARKTGGEEQSVLPDADLEFHQSEYTRLRSLLEREHERSSLPEAATAMSAISDLVVRVRSTSL